MGPTSASISSTPCVSRLAWFAFSDEKAMPPRLIKPLAKMSRSFSFAVITPTLRPDFCAAGKMVSARRNFDEFIITSWPEAVS